MESDEQLARRLQAEEDAELARALAASLEVARPPGTRVEEGPPQPSSGGGWAARLRFGVAVVQRHERARAALARDLPVLARVKADADEAVAVDAAFCALDGESGDGAPPLHPTLALVSALCAWFKGGEGGFTWVTSPPCATCGGPTVSAGATSATTPAEAAGLASRVELYTCTRRCGARPGGTRFPRLNCPLALWHPAHRRGRCGEWANAFGAALAALGVDARHVVDITGDHVWCEVWVDEGGGRWVHVDPCEGAVDTPLLYEAGWGKAPALVVAYGKGGVSDVTHRYTVVRGAELAARRAGAGVPPSLDAVCAGLSAESVRALGGGPVEAGRVAADAAVLAGGRPEPAAGGSAPLPGRTSGSAAWVAGRGEGGRPGGARPPAAEPAGRRPTRYARVAPLAPPTGGRPGPPGSVRLQAHPAASSAPPPSLAGLHARASGPHPPAEGPAAAFDGRAHTKWLAHGPPSASRPAWLEVRLGPRQDGVRPPVVVPVAYSLTSGNDAPGRDPLAWRVEGRAGRGAWAVLDAQAVPASPFPGRGGDSQLFAIPGATPVDALRLVVTGAAAGSGADAVQLAAWEVWVEEGAPAPPPPPPPPPPRPPLSKEAFAAAVRAAFERRVAGGEAPNAAAVGALADVTGREDT